MEKSAQTEVSQNDKETDSNKNVIAAEIFSIAKNQDLSDTLATTNTAAAPKKSCHSCKKQQENILLCSGCKLVAYCSSVCQKAHWPEHKKTCAWQLHKEEEELKKKIANLPVYKCIEWFSLGERIGEGNFSEIYRARDIRTNEWYALKVISKMRLRQVNKEKDVEMERYCLKKLAGSAYVIRHFDTFSDEHTLYVQLELVQGMELWHRVRAFGAIAKPLINYYFAHLLKALEYLHQHGIVHRDLKAENVMLEHGTHQLKLIDFGTARDIQNNDIKGSGQGGKGKKNYEHFVGTPNFMPPEQIRNKGSSQESDIYALGGLFYQIASGHPPFTGASQYLIFQKSLEQDAFFHDEVFSADLKDLIIGMMKKEPSERLTIAQIRQHKYFAQYDFENIPSYEECRQQIDAEAAHLINIQKEIYKNLAQYDRQEQKIDELFDQYETELQQITEKFDEQQKQHLLKRIMLMRKQAKFLANIVEEFVWDQ